jgi:hypothetical protein
LGSYKNKAPILAAPNIDLYLIIIDSYSALLQNRGFPPYSPHLNLAETLWRIMKTKWIRPQDYASSDNLFYTVNRALAAVGDTLGIKLKHNAA